jgi:methionine-rich copper-binding protein CopC
VFISSGHDEYVSGPQRQGIEDARAAGVNMMFLSGNEMFWKTRFENSTDGTNTAYRTMVCYKETKPEQKIDPNSAWTGTWRDPTLSPPSDGGRPENAVTGTLFMVNGYRADAMQVPASYGRNRFWRNTSIASATGTTTFPTGTLGYEWDTDADNGFRPPGAVPLSFTNVNVTGGQYVLQDYGNTYGEGPMTHSLMLYRDQTSGALVFGAGTVQWSWGLDNDHVYPPGAPASTPTVPAIQQSTVNMLADMGVQPRSLMAGLSIATKSTDTSGPAVAVAAPAAGSTVPAGSTQTIQGTATDVGGGKVGVVEVSTDGGTTWKRATGLDNWTYTWTPTVLGAAAVKVRAADDGATIGPVQTINVTVGPQQCPCTVFGNQVPAKPDAADGSAIEVGMKFTTSINASVTGVRFYKSAANTGTHAGSLWTSAGQRLATGTYTGESASGWQTLTFATPVLIRAGQTYITSYTAPAGHYSADGAFFATKGAGVVPLTAPASTASSGNGVYRYGSGFPDSSSNSANYYVDVVVTTDTADNQPPTVTAISPADGATGAYTDTTVTTTFSEAIDPASVNVTVKAGATAVPGTTTVDDKVATFTSTNLLSANTTYTVTSTASDGFGNALATPKTWSFTTGSSSAPCPCTVFGAATPGIMDAADASNVELGMKIQPSVNALVTGVRFYKSAANTGTHTGTLWTSAGVSLATGTFTGETATGWQILIFATPVQVRSGQIYVVSYRAPNGHYAADRNYFATNGAGRGVVTAPSSPQVAGQSVYVYGGGFPSNSFNATNYWVDVVVDTTGADSAPPTVTSTDPGSNATAVSTNGGLTANFSEQVEPSSVQFTLADPGGAIVAGTTAVAPDGRSAVFSPNTPLAGTTVYTARVSATDLVGNAMATPYSWSFTSGAAGSCPCSLFRPTDTPAGTGTGGALEMGTRIRTDANGWITGVRFFKTAGDPGTHTGTLWSAAGAQLATGTYTGESGSGWQTLSFAQPVQVTAGSSYVVSYFSSAGRYGYTTQYFTMDKVYGPLTGLATSATASNGVWRYGSGGVFPTGDGNSTNYWVDVVFTTTRP